MVLVSSFAVALLSWLVLEGHVEDPWLSHETDYLAGLVAAVCLAAVLMTWPIRARQKLALVVLWTIKAATALGIMLFYEAHYDSLDAYALHQNARLGVYALEHMGWGRGTENLTILLQGVYAVLPASYHLAKILLSFIGLTGVYLVYRGAMRAWGGSSLLPLFLLALFPGVLFWSSILGKEPLMIFAVGLFTYGLGRFRSSGRILSGILFILLGILLAGAIRIWMVYILLAPLLLMVAVDPRLSRAVKLTWVVVVLSVGVMFWLPSIERVGVTTESDVVEHLDTLSKGWASGGSAQEAPEFEVSSDLIRFLPVGAFTALFRPLPGEITTVFGILAGLENLLLLSLVVISAIRFPKCLRDPLFLGLAVLVGMWAGIYGFVSYQNLGTAVRFKTQILPIVLLLVMFPWWQRLAYRDRHSLTISPSIRRGP